jgi:hypothetical protein
VLQTLDAVSHVPPLPFHLRTGHAETVVIANDFVVASILQLQPVCRCSHLLATVASDLGVKLN